MATSTSACRIRRTFCRRSKVRARFRTDRNSRKHCRGPHNTKTVIPRKFVPRPPQDPGAARGRFPADPRRDRGSVASSRYRLPLPPADPSAAQATSQRRPPRPRSLHFQVSDRPAPIAERASARDHLALRPFSEGFEISQQALGLRIATNPRAVLNLFLGRQNTANPALVCFWLLTTECFPQQLECGAAILLIDQRCAACR